jgi:polar amino acid transport system substrate-binding protein
LPPMSLEGAPSAPGAMFEVVAELTKRANLPATITFAPWPRAIYLTNNLKRTAIFPLTRTPEREKNFRWLVPLFQENYVFIANGKERFDLQHPEAMKDKRVGILRGSAMISELKASGYLNIIETSSVNEGRRFLARGIVDAMVGDRDIVRRSLIGLPEADLFEMSKPVRKTYTWLGGSLDFTEAEAAQLEKAMASMVEDGTYARILKKYALAPD